MISFRVISANIPRAALQILFLLLLGGCVLQAFGQSINSGTVIGVVKDQSSAVISGAKVEISNALTGYQQTTNTDDNGTFRFNNVPFNPYHLAITHAGFNAATQDVAVRTTVPANVNITLAVAGSQETVTVEALGADVIENEPDAHSDVDTSTIEKLPITMA
ncbi:MAG TPA: carboxypeptidase-like regulatory domain-containing protein, partial [Terriglobales bacterium]|nr:carboxypeptidase-like regulatory domain-containing protein [Terriglobales bacterium]